MDDVQEVKQIIDSLKNLTKFSDRYPVFEDYRRLITSGLSLEAGIHAIKAVVEFGTPADVTNDPGASLIGSLAGSHFPRDHGKAAIPTILEIYPSYSKQARFYAISLLMNIPEPEGAEAVMGLIRQYIHEGGIPDHALNSRYQHPLHVEVYFPDLLDYARLALPFHAFKIWQMCLNYCESGLLKPERIASRTNSILDEYRVLKAKMLPVQMDWHDDEYGYLADRETAGLLLDLLRYFPTGDVKGELSSSLVDFHDPVLLCWSVISALWLELPVQQDVIEAIAASDEARRPFFEKLKEHKRSSLYPSKYHTKEAFAQSDFVNWLTFPTELGHAPYAIKLTHKIIVQTSEDTVEWFLFRYKDDDKESSDWLAGWSGPFPIDSLPGEILIPGGTFSHSYLWDSKSPEDHIGLNDEPDPSRKITVVAYGPGSSSGD